MKKKVYSLMMLLTGILLMAGFSESKAQDPYFVEMIQPNEPGIEVVLGSEFLISWTDNLSQPVKIKLSLDGGSTYNILLANNVTGSTWLWDTDLTPGLSENSTCRILVKSVVDGSVNDASENNFSLVNEIDPSIRVIQPNETGIQWILGGSNLISWTDNLSGNVGLELVDYSNPGSPVFIGIANDVPGSTYSWSIPEGLTAHGNYKIKIYSMDNTAVQDKSDNYFELSETGDGFIEILQPDGGEIWDRGSEHMISWTDNLTEPVIVQLWKNDVKVRNIVNSTEGSTYVWEIPADEPLGDDYEIRIKSTANPAIADISEDYFEISQENNGFIQVLQPNNGEQWLRGTSKLISWTDNLSGNVGIELNDVGAGTFTNLATDVEGSTYSWDIPADQTAHGDYKIKIYSMDDPANINDKSDNNFSILATLPGSITVLQPNVPGIQWAQGTEHLISWTDNLSEPVIIQLWKNGAKEYNIAENVEGSTYNWTIPADQTKADDYQIRVKSSANASISDYSDSDFEITGMPPGSFITVIQPNGGESWEIGSAYLISWTDNISGNVGLELVDYSQTPTTFTTIATDVPGSTYAWTITDGTYDIGDDYKIKIYAMDDPTLQDKSDDYFSIVPDMMFSVHPNPVNQTMTLDLTKMNEGMYDAVLYNQFNLAVIEDTFKAGEIVQINTTNLPNGLYFLMLKTADGMKSQKIIVQH